MNTTMVKLVAVLIEDKQIGGFTAYLERFPNVISDGDTEQEALEGLKGAFFAMVKDKLEEDAEEMHHPINLQGESIKRTSLTICA